MHLSQQLLAIVSLFSATVLAKPMMPIETDPILPTSSSTIGTALTAAATASAVTVTSKPQMDIQNRPERAPFHTGLCIADLTQTDMSRGNFADYIEEGPHWKLALDIVDANNQTIGSAPPTVVEGRSLELLSWLPLPFVAAPANGSTVDFNYGNVTRFSSEKKKGIPSCNAGQWQATGPNPHRSVKCRFNCAWPKTGLMHKASNGQTFDKLAAPVNPGGPIHPEQGTT